MTAEQIKMVDELQSCTFLPGSYTKRFVKNMAMMKDKELTVNQAAFLVKTRKAYRKQIAAIKKPRYY